MKKIKLFPAPHIEIRVHVSEKMIADMKECRRLIDPDCAKCSWDKVEFEGTGLCEYPEVQRQVLEDEDKKRNYQSN